MNILSTDPLDDLTQHDESHIAVGEFLTGFRIGLQRHDVGNGLLRRAAVIFDGIVCDQTADVSQQVPHSNLVFAIGRELGQIRRDRGIHINLALLDQDHHTGRRGDRLGQRGEIEHCVDCHRYLVRHRLTKTISLPECNSAPPSYNNHRSRHFALTEPFVDQFINQSQPRGVKAERFRIHNRH